MYYQKKMRCVRPILCTTFIAAALGVATSGFAQEVTLSLPESREGLRDRLEAASLSISLNRTEATPQDYIAAARADYRRLLTALYTRGYYAPTISIRVNGREASSLAPLDAPPAIESITISVDPSQPFEFGVAQVRPLPQGAEIVEDFRPGERAKSDAIREAASQAISSWRAAGFAKARVTDQSLRANHIDRVLDANIDITPGPQLTFGPLSVTGNEAVRTSAISRIAGLPEGAVFSPETLDQVASRLRRTGAFDSVALTEADQIGPNDTLPIAVAIAESKPRRFGFGLELSSLDGLTVSSFWMHRNAFGGAEQFRVDGEISGIGGETGGTDYSIGTSLSVPAIYGPDTTGRASFSISRQDEPTFEIDKISSEIGATRIIDDDLTASVGLGLLRAEEQTAAGTRQYTLLTFPLGLEWDLRDSATNTKEGAYVDFDVTPFLGVDGIGDGARFFADARGYASFAQDDRVTLAARAQVGSLLGAEPDDAPADFLFFSGGGGTVRGQPYKSLSVLDGMGAERGGASFAGLQLETRVSVSDAISVVGFYDYGHVGDTSVPLEEGDWHAGTGLGLRYNTGIGPIRLDIGTPANGSDAFEEVQVYIGIGQAF